MIKEQMKVVNEKNIIKQNDMVKQTIKRIKMTGSDQLKKQCDLIYKNLRIANKNGILKIKVFNDDELQRFNNIKGIINDLKKL